MSYEEMLQQISQEMSMDASTVNAVYKSFWKFIRNKVKEVPVKELQTEEDFSKYRTSFNIPSLGKFAIDWKYIQRIRTNINNKNKTK